MPIMPQDLVHKTETAMSGAFARVALAVTAVIALLVAYDWRQARNFSTQEAMDSAQLARNISEGKGFTTQFIRPFSMFLVKRANQERLNSLTQEEVADICRVRGAHPDISNPPAYPTLLAGWMKVLPFRSQLPQKPGEQFIRYQPDFLITVLNQLLFVGTVLLVFFLARKIFDSMVAWLSAILMFGADILWRFSASGLSTMLLLFLFVLLIGALVQFERALADAAVPARKILGLALLLGALLGLGMLTRYAYGVLMLPVLAYVLIFANRWRLPAAAVVVAAFAAVVTPWIVRNLAISGMPFGTATYAPIEHSLFFQQHRLERSLDPDFTQIPLITLWWKFFTNLRLIISNELSHLGGGWVFGFFVAGLLVGFRNPALKRLRYFTLATLMTLIVAQAIGRTALSDDSPDINSENLLVLLVPLVVIFGVSFFHTLLDQLTLPAGMFIPLTWIRRAVITLFVIACTLPFTASFLPGRTTSLAFHPAVVFPPYYPPDIQKVSGWMNEGELIMSDAPWAVAWYGNRQSVWLTLDARGQFYTLTDYVKSVRALYLTPLSLDARVLSQWARGGSEWSWGELVVSSQMRQELPGGFPLVKSYRLHEQLFLTDWERWARPEEPTGKR